MKTKICTKCKIEKDEIHFRNEPRGKLGLTAKCKECEFEYRKENVLNKSDYDKKYREINSERLICNDKIRKKEFYTLYPWKKTYNLIQQRCNNPNAENYKYYGGRGIKFLITEEELKELWFRDRAYEMEVPSIDRIDSDNDYIFENCQYLELSENSRKSHLDRIFKTRRI